MFYSKKRLAAPAILLFFLAAGLLQACQQENKYTKIKLEEVIGHVALPDLEDSAENSAGGIKKVATVRRTRESGSAIKPLPADIDTELPDFSRYDDVREKKTAFFNFLRPIVRKENREVLKERAYVLLKWQRFRKGEELSELEVQYLRRLAEKYRVDAGYSDGTGFFREMLIHIDKIPVSLALIQAAKESAWGTSYFARKGNNLFGQWCFQGGCGIVPRRRPEGASYEVRKFADVSGSVRAYIRNLNSHPAYKEMRMKRYRMRLAGLQPDPHLMAGGLESYSEIGMQYVKTVRQMIRGNEKFMGIHEPAAGS
ncbi:MAG: glucosaminidase domain-containing protein [Desulfosalsimonadaceae bacterium]